MNPAVLLTTLGGEQIVRRDPKPLEIGQINAKIVKTNNPPGWGISCMVPYKYLDDVNMRWVRQESGATRFLGLHDTDRDTAKRRLIDLLREEGFTGTLHFMKG